MSEDQTYILLQEVSKKYKETVALDKVTFDVGQGEIFGYIGPNGAGKTTTIKILAGLMSSYQGEYRIYKSSPATIHKELGYLPQGVSFQNWRTVDNVLRTFGTLSGLDAEFLEEQIEKITELLALKEIKNRSISKLSGGMVQKLGLAQALLNNPKFLVLDEPLSGLDPASRYQLKNIIKNLSKDGTTVFFSSHILSDVQDIADRIAIINKGRILKIGDTKRLTIDLYPYYIFEVSTFEDIENTELLNSFKNINHIERKSSNKILLHIDKKADLRSFSRDLMVKLSDQKYTIQNFGSITPNLDEVYLKYVKGN